MMYDVIQQPETQVNGPAAETTTGGGEDGGGYEIPIPTHVAPSSPYVNAYDTIQ